MEAEHPQQKETSIAIVEAVSSARNVSETALPPLYEAVEPDCVDSLFRSTTDQDRSGYISFEYAGCQVNVHDAEDGDIHVEVEC